jgi:hypothetical protein
MDYFLSGHGGSDSVETQTLKVTLVTFCSFGTGLDIPTSWRVFDALCSNNSATINALKHQTYVPGQTVPNMTLYPTTDFTSGIFTVGTGKIPLRSLDGGQFTLRDFSMFYRDASIVYWIACLN